MSDYLVRRLKTSDVAEVWETFHDQPGFRASRTIGFYDESEVEYWSYDKQSLCLVLEHEVVVLSETLRVIVGFAFVKYISPIWAMLDGFYVLPDHRGQETYKLLLKTMQAEVEAHGTEYISTLVDEELWPLLKRSGFQRGNGYKTLPREGYRL